ncbi:MAG: 50S ribosomal protein L30 [Anaerolineae bacterium]|nr:50S ribosomal protein L30 [Anaerolineae bacterium]MDW8173824.1 50S ribosomal protein L30 [Anaerolineae bacterium]
MSEAKKVRIKLVRSSIGYEKSQRATLIAMGLRRLQQTVELPDSPQTRGMIYKVRHLVQVEEIRE